MRCILKKQDDLVGALEYLEYVLKTDLHAPQPNWLNIATHHNNIGLVFQNQEKYTEALRSYDCALEIFRTSISPSIFR